MNVSICSSTTLSLSGEADDNIFFNVSGSVWSGTAGSLAPSEGWRENANGGPGRAPRSRHPWVRVMATFR